MKPHWRNVKPKLLVGVLLAIRVPRLQQRANALTV